VTAFSVKIQNDPSLVALLDVGQLQSCRFGPPQAAANQNREDRTISFTPHGVAIRHSHEGLDLFGTKPVPQSNANTLCTFDAPNAGGQLWTEQSGVGRLMRKSPDGGKAQVDHRRRQSPGLQFKPVPQDHGFVKAGRGSEQYHVTKSSIAKRYERFDSEDRSVFNTALFANSRSGRRSTRFGVFVVCRVFLRLIHKRSPLPLVRMYASDAGWR
jgi:hypothetical protein